MLFRSTFVDIEAWGKQGELVAKYLSKGSLAMVEGRLKLDQWEDKASGQKRSKIKVVLDNVQFLSSRGSGGGGAGGGASAPSDDGGEGSAPPPRGGGKPAASSGNIDEDVPF